MRLKVAPTAFDELSSDYFRLPAGELRQYIADEKWGFSETAAAGVVDEILMNPHLRFCGYSVHLSRASSSESFFRSGIREFAAAVARLAERTATIPTVLDIGGGWPRGREPEVGSLEDLSGLTVEQCAQLVTAELSSIPREGAGHPALWLEPGRYIVGNAVVLLTTVGSIKRDLGRVWINVDASTNNLMRIDTNGSYYRILPASRMHDTYEEQCIVVGPTCVASVLGTGRRLPKLERGDLLVILDAGMYAETTSTQFNGVPRPPTVLVWNGEAEVIRRRETVNDVFATHRVPERLLCGGPDHRSAQ